MSQPPNATRDFAGSVASDPLGTPLARAVFEATAEGLLLLAPEGVVVAMNAAFGTLYGIDPGGAIGHHYTAFTKNIEVRRLDTAIEEESWVTLRALRGECVEGIVQTVRNCETGREFTARCAASPHFENGNFVLTTITVEDVTEWMLSRQRLEAALSAAEVGVWWIDLVNGKVWGDKNFARIYGLTDEEIDGGPLSRAYDLIHPDDRESVTEALRVAASSGEAHELEFRVVGRDGCARWLLSRGRSEKNKDGIPIRRMGSAVDITRQKEAEESLRRTGEIFEHLVRNSPLGIYAVDADFRLSLVSQGAQKVFENVRPLIGRDFEEVMRTVWDEPFASEAIRHFSHTLTTGEPYHAASTVERRIDLGEVESYDWKIERVNLPDGRPGVVCHFYDLSEHQRHEADLERRVRERTEDLTRANDELNSFASSVAHDLRAPLRTIALTSQMLREGDEGRFSPEERELLERQTRGAKRLGGIIDDLLKFARLANADFHSIPFDFSRTARAAAVEVTSRGWAKPPSVEVQAGLRAQGDPNLIGYALTNLLDNAMKFSPEGGQVVVGKHDGAFYVRDEGVGFDMAYAGKLFLAFERLVDQKTFEGTGLGLANVRRIVERHGGKVWAQSEPGKGSTFWFTLS
jgi:PAS domain S-box-containing protein